LKIKHSLSNIWEYLTNVKFVRLDHNFIYQLARIILSPSA
jgi:hypothetical protein